MLSRLIKRMKLRPYEQADRPFLRTLFLAARKANWHWLDNGEWTLEDFDRVTLGERVLVAEQDGHRIGFAAVLPNDNFLHSLFVDPHWQGQGVGTALLKAVQSALTSTGALKCMKANKPAVAFYQQHGWTIISDGEGEHGDYWLMHFVL